MAESIIYGVAQTIIENLGSQIFQEIGELYGVQNEIEMLRGTVSRVQAVLRDAEEQERHNHQVEDWLERLRGAVDEANELLNRYVTETLRRRRETRIIQKVRTFFSKSNQIAFRFNMNVKLKKIRKKLDAIVKDSTTVAAAEGLDKEKID